jgi:NAD+ synthase (glutamine-hydrolysing)
MSSVFTSKISKIDAKKLSDNLGITYKNRNLSTLIKQINNALKIDFKGKPADVTEENIQARARGIFLMALANKGKGVVLSTSNKSESAVGYSTLYGDMVGAYAPIKDIPKTMVYQLAKYINKNQEIIPERIITRAPSAELRDNQKDQDSLPDYETLDKVIDLYIEKNKSINEIIKAGFQPIIVKKIVKLILSSEFKRRQSPPGPKVTTKAFGRDRRYPITNNYLG